MIGRLARPAAAAGAGALTLLATTAVLGAPNPTWAIAFFLAFFVGAALLASDRRPQPWRMSRGAMVVPAERAADAMQRGPVEHFDERAKRALTLSQYEAVRLQHNYIGPEHLLVGVVQEGGAAARALASLGVDESKVKQAIESRIGRGRAGATPQEISLTPRTKRVMEFAVDEGRKAGAERVGTEHLLLAIVRDEGSVAFEMLGSLGATPDRVLMAIRQGASAPDAPRTRNPFSRFTDRSKRTLALAQDEAIRFNHNYIGTDHLLLGLIREGEGVPARVFDSLGITYVDARRHIENKLGRGEGPQASEITLSPPVKKAIDLADEESRRLGHHDTRPEHLLLGLVSEEETRGGGALSLLGLSPEKVRQAVFAALTPGEGGLRIEGPGNTSFDRFNDRAKRVLALAQDEAIRMRHGYIGTEHLLLGLLRDAEGAGGRALADAGLDLNKLRTAVEFMIQPETSEPRPPTGIALSPRAKRTIDLAVEDAESGDGRVGTGHLLIGLLREGEGMAMGILESLGVRRDRLETLVRERMATLS